MKFLPSLTLALGLLATNLSWAETLPNEVRQTEANAQKLAKQVQTQVEQLDAKRQEDFNAWRQARHELLALEAYNQRQEKWNASLKTELVSLDEQLTSLEATRSQLEPLLDEMLGTLKKITQSEFPFNKAASSTKLNNLDKLLVRVDISLAEKLRQLLTTYRQAVEAGRTLEINREFIATSSGTEKTQHTLLRLGRLGLYALTEDKKQGYVWQATQEQWQALTSSQTKQLNLAINLTEARGLPELLQLPLSISLNSANQGRK